LPLVKFTYNNSYQTTIGMTPYEALYGLRCQTPVCWEKVGDQKLIRTELVQITMDKIKIIKVRMKAVYGSQKNYAYNQRSHLEFQIEDKMFFKVALWNNIIWFGMKGKMAPRYIGPFKVIERIWLVAYRLALSSYLFRIHDVFHVSLLYKAEVNPLGVTTSSCWSQTNMNYWSYKKELRNKKVPIVKTL